MEQTLLPAVGESVYYALPMRVFLHFVVYGVSVAALVVFVYPNNVLWLLRQDGITYSNLLLPLICIAYASTIVDVESYRRLWHEAHVPRWLQVVVYLAVLGIPFNGAQPQGRCFLVYKLNMIVCSLLVTRCVPILSFYKEVKVKRATMQGTEAHEFELISSFEDFKKVLHDRSHIFAQLNSKYSADISIFLLILVSLAIGCGAVVFITKLQDRPVGDFFTVLRLVGLIVTSIVLILVLWNLSTLNDVILEMPRIAKVEDHMLSGVDSYFQNRMVTFKVLGIQVDRLLIQTVLVPVSVSILTAVVPIWIEFVKAGATGEC